MIEIVELAADLIKNWFEGRQKIDQAERERKIAIINTQARLASDEETHNSAWELAALADSDRFLRRISFAILAFPFLYAIKDPQAVAYYFNTALAAMPSWYVKSFMSILGAVWGISSLKNTLPAIIRQIVNAVNSDGKNP